MVATEAEGRSRFEGVARGRAPVRPEPGSPEDRLRSSASVGAACCFSGGLCAAVGLCVARFSGS